MAAAGRTPAGRRASGQRHDGRVAVVLRAVAGDDADPVPVLPDLAHGASQDDPLAERGGHRLGDADRSAGYPVLLSSPVDREERVQSALECA